MSPAALPPSASPRQLAHWLRQQLAASWEQQQVTIGEMIWPQSQLVLLLEYALLSARDVRAGLTLWCECLPLLGLPWYPTLSGTYPRLRLQFAPREAAADPHPLWYLLQLLHLRLKHWHPAQPWRLEWPQRLTALPPAPDLLASRFAPQPALELDLADWPASPYPEWQDLHAPLATILHRLHRLGAQPRGRLEEIKVLLEQALPARPPLPQLAHQLGLPVRSLQRQLQQHGTRYSQLLDEVRRNRAIALLCHEQHSAQAVGLALGYQDAPSFQRAFRHWFGMTPGAFRRRYFELDPYGHHQPEVSLYYAINQLQQQSLRQYSGARIWISLRNLAFDKAVQVLCEDQDGIWRPYPATFERFIGPERELWSTPSLPVHHPLRFRIEYQAGGQRFQDNNGGQDYALEQAVLLGPQPAVYHQLLVCPTDGSHSAVLVRLFSRDPWPAAWACWQQAGQTRRHPLTRQPCGPAWRWEALVPGPDADTPLFFEFGAADRPQMKLDNAGEGFLPQPW